MSVSMEKVSPILTPRPLSTPTSQELTSRYDVEPAHTSHVLKVCSTTVVYNGKYYYIINVEYHHFITQKRNCFFHSFQLLVYVGVNLVF